MELEQLEALALDENRTAALSALVPGTEDHDFWSAIAYQREGRLDEVDAILHGWGRRHGYTERRRQIELRQLLLRAEQDLSRHVHQLAELSGAILDHPREVESEQATHPTRLDPACIAGRAVIEEAFRRDRGLGAVTDEGLPHLLQFTLDSERLRQLLGRLSRSGLPGLVDAIALELSEKASRGFGALSVHRALTIAELVALADRLPSLRTDPAWVSAMLCRTRPGPHVDVEGDPVARSAWLEACWQLVEGLPPSFAALKANIAYHRLEVDLKLDRFDRDKLLAYLSIPRRLDYVRGSWLQSLHSSVVASLHESFSDSTGLPAVGQDEPVVRAHLAHHLLIEGDEAFRPYLEPSWLERLLAEVKLLVGAPDPERWTEVLGAADAIALRQRVDIELLPSNARLFGRNDEVALQVALKNTDVLRVRVFRMDTAAWFRTHGGDVDARVDLDGLAPAWEEVRPAPANAMLRSQQRIVIPAAQRPGTYVVELVGNGKASRALVRKGNLRMLTRPSPAGLSVRIVDETGQERPDAWLLMGGQAYHPRSDGSITLPFTTRPGPMPVLLQDSEIAVASTVELPLEHYHLALEVDLDRQALVPGFEASGILRPQLLVGGQPTSLALLEEPFVEITVTDRTGVTARRRTPVTLSDERDVALAFPVPEHPDRLVVALGGRVRVLSEQRTLDLREEWTAEVGTLLRTDATDCPHLRCQAVEGGAPRHTLHLLGHSGEPRPGRALSVGLTHRWVNFPIERTLATDEHGTVDLGALTDIKAIWVRSPSGAGRTFSLYPARPIVARHWWAREGDEIVLPTPPEDAQPLEAWQLVELRGGAPAFDHSALVKVEPGLMRIVGLPAGTHRLRIYDFQVELTVVPAQTPNVHGWALLPTESVETALRPTVLGQVALGPDTLQIHVIAPTPRTRVHIIGTALWRAPTWAQGSFTTLSPGHRAHSQREAVYLSGRDIGDEARYVLDRRSYPRRPGSLLERPSVLLNPWSLRTTQTSVQAASAGGAWGAPAAGPTGAPAAAPSGRSEEDAYFAELPVEAYEFLSEPAVVLQDLVPDASGQLRVPLAELGHAQMLRIVCVDPTALTQRVVPLPERSLAVRDRRLQAALPADHHWRESRRLVPLLPGETLTLAERATSRIETVDTVEKLWRALVALGGDPDLAAWDFLPRWGGLSREEKLSLYSKYACHELALFIWFKDRPLFDEALRPYLANKLYPTFIDRFLLGEDLRAFLEPWRFQKLNAIERALLANAIVGAKRSIALHLRDLTELEPVDPEREDKLVETFLAGSRLAGDGPGAVSEPEPFAPPPPTSASEATFGPADTARRRSRQRAALRDEPAAEKAEMAGDALFLDIEDRRNSKPLFRSADQTREWAEHNWWHKRVEETGPWLVPPSRLWADRAVHSVGPFLSSHVGDATVSFAASVAALAVLDLPFAAQPARIDVQGSGLTLTAATPMLVALAELTPVQGEPTGEVLVGESWFRQDDRWEWEGAEQREKYVAGELVVHVVYTLRVVVTNPTSRVQRLSVLVQIPEGAIAVSGGIATKTHRIELAPYETTSLEVSFYFPLPGQFRHYGARVTRDDVLMAAAADRTWRVVRVPTTTDPDSWAHVSQHGSLDDVVRWLTHHNLGRVDLDRMAWRLRDKAAFERIVNTLAEKHVYSDTVWAYSLLHRDVRRIQEWLAHQSWLDALGPLETRLVQIEPVERGLYQHLEYAPLVNARAHPLGGRRTVLNEGLLAQWQAFLQRVALKSAPEIEDWLAAAHYLFVMDRPDEAIRALERCSRAGGPRVRAQLQYDLLRAHAAVVREDLPAARSLVWPHVAHPVDRWRRRFQELAAMLDEVEGKTPGAVDVSESREGTMAALASEQPTLALRVEGEQLVLEHRLLERATLRFHLMDVELLFSREPFLGAAGDRFAIVDPGQSLEVTLAASNGGPGRTIVPLPPELLRKNVVIEVVAGALRRTATHLANDLQISLMAPYGQLRVARRSTGVALPGTYVKAYARKRGGGVAFYKDGYTDLRGRFDYATLSTHDLDQVERFALLVLHDEAGAQVLEAEPPAR